MIKQLHFLLLAILPLSSLFCTDNSDAAFDTFVSKPKPDSVIKELPKDWPQYSIYYSAHKQEAALLGLQNLEEGYDGLQLRIWYPERTKQIMVMIRRTPKRWEGYRYLYDYTGDSAQQVENIKNVQIRKLTPNSGWKNLIPKLLSLDITTLPNDMDIPGYKTGGADGDTYCVEVGTPDKYRFYIYDSIKDNNLPQAKKMYTIIDLLNHEFDIESYGF